MPILPSVLSRAVGATMLSYSLAVSADTLPDSHAPIGVMGDHRHHAGEWMVSYRYMSMAMEDNLRGNDSISPPSIVSSISNPFAPPATVRVVPLEMTTQMHMLGFMYAPNDAITLMAMASYLEKEMRHQTFMGMAGATALGTFTTRSGGVGDTKVSALINVMDEQHQKLHINLGFSLPTGEITATDAVLTPMNTRPTLRLPYAMQLGSGTYDFEPGLTYSGSSDHVAWGAQLKANFRLGDNDEEYSLGDEISVSGWSSYRLSNWLSGSLRLTYSDIDSIDGRDTSISAPVTTANPGNYGGTRWDAAFGFNTVTHSGHRLAFEYSIPIEQNLNGVQMEMQSMWMLGYQYAF